MKKHKGRGLFIFLCLFPATLLVILFMMVPTVQVFYTSLLNKPNFVAESKFVWFKNFVTLFKDARFVESLRNTVLYIVLITAIVIVLALLYANILQRKDIKGISFWSFIFYIPNLLSMVVVAGVFSAIYAPSNGLINAFFRGIGLDGLQQQWLGNESIINYSIIVALIWQAVGYYMVMYRASMAAVPVQLYEAADLEGASKWTQFFKITLPLIWTNIRTTLTFFVTSTINLSFMFIQLTTEGSLGTESALNYMYSKAFGGNYSYGMTIAAVTFIFSFVLAALLNQTTKREVYQY